MQYSTIRRETMAELFTQEQLAALMPNASSENVVQYTSALQQYCTKAEINTTLRLCHLLAQLAHESAELRSSSENLNYSSAALRQIFSRYFPTDAVANQYQRQPERIANRVYASRMGNGTESSGDGWRYRGRGLIQLTGKANYQTCGTDLGLDLVENPEQVSDNPAIAVQTALWFWQTKDLNLLAETNWKLSLRKLMVALTA
jgi:putative chitinase